MIRCGPVRINRCGESAVLADFDTLAAVGGYRALLERWPIDGVGEIVSGALTLLIRFQPSIISESRLFAALMEPRGDGANTFPSGANQAATSSPPVVVAIPVWYDGADLEEVGALTGLGVAGVIREHTAQIWTSAFCGFSPGFSYLVGGSPALTVPRRSTSRSAVPAGAVALAGEFSAVYPRRSPGGWQLIGRTDAAMWSLDRSIPALAPAGTRIQFVAIQN